jgi:hypothetical protein
MSHQPDPDDHGEAPKSFRGAKFGSAGDSAGSTAPDSPKYDGSVAGPAGAGSVHARAGSNGDRLYAEPSDTIAAPASSAKRRSSGPAWNGIAA